MLLRVILSAAVIVVFLPSITVAETSAIPPIVLQGCAQKVKAKHFNVFSNASALSASGRGDQVVGFDISFVNTTEKVATLVLLRIGDTDFAKTGVFSPGAVIAWRLAAAPGACAVRAVRFADGSEWSVLGEEASQSPAPTASAVPSPIPTKGLARVRSSAVVDRDQKSKVTASGKIAKPSPKAKTPATYHSLPLGFTAASGTAISTGFASCAADIQHLSVHNDYTQPVSFSLAVAAEEPPIPPRASDAQLVGRENFDAGETRTLSMQVEKCGTGVHAWIIDLSFGKTGSKAAHP